MLLRCFRRREEDRCLLLLRRLLLRLRRRLLRCRSLLLPLEYDEDGEDEE